MDEKKREEKREGEREREERLRLKRRGEMRLRLEVLVVCPDGGAATRAHKGLFCFSREG